MNRLRYIPQKTFTLSPSVARVTNANFNSFFDGRCREALLVDQPIAIIDPCHDRRVCRRVTPRWNYEESGHELFPWTKTLIHGGRGRRARGARRW